MNIKNMLKSSRKRILHIALLSLVLNTVYAFREFRSRNLEQIILVFNDGGIQPDFGNNAFFCCYV